jgi:chlorite dismutase
MNHPEQPPLDLRERGAPIDGQPQVLDARLFMQLLVLRPTELTSDTPRSLGQSIKDEGMGVVIYEDAVDPLALGVLTFSVEPLDFVDKVRKALLGHGAGFSVRHEFSMFGRAYSTGYEDNLEYWLLRRPVETVLNPAWPWAIWYPLRRSGSFEKLEPREKGSVLREHAEIGKAYGRADLAHDVRLACHGLDANDNEFVIGLIGKDLHPLSHVVQKMRATRQTSEYINQMGPFFVGRAVFRSAG